MSAVDSVLERLDRAKRNGSGWTARCPSHEDREPSLSVGVGDGGRVLLNCHAGCTTENIVAALGLTMSDLFDPPAPLVRVPDVRSEYVYSDAAGEPSFRSVRLDRDDGSKQIWQEHLVAGSWVKGLGDVERLLYRLPELANATVIHVAEGERCADRLREIGVVATTAPMGAGKWHKGYVACLSHAATVLVWPDADEPGRAHADDIVRSLQGVVADVRVVELGADRQDGYDVADLLADAARDGVTDLKAYARESAASAVTAAVWMERRARSTTVLALERVEPGTGTAVRVVVRERAVDGATFVNAEPDKVPANWGGDGEAVAWSEGEPLMIVGPDGVGKTSVAQQLVRCRVGLNDSLLGLPAKPAVGKVLYIAADRPRQAARSMRRMVSPGDLEILRERLVVWKGPLPVSLIGNPQALVSLADEHDATDVFIDSLKDVAADLSKDETGSHVNIAFQELIASDRELVVLHHQRKAQQGAAKPKTLADVYGSRWLTAGMGSVLLLWGEPGDLIVDLKHLKQPCEEVGPFAVIHDHVRGTCAIHDAADLEQLLATLANGLTVNDAARHLFSTERPDRNQVEKARRRLEGLTTRSRATRRDDPDGLARYHTPEKTAVTPRDHQRDVTNADTHHHETAISTVTQGVTQGHAGNRSRTPLKKGVCVTPGQDEEDSPTTLPTASAESHHVVPSDAAADDGQDVARVGEVLPSLDEALADPELYAKYVAPYGQFVDEQGVPVEEIEGLVGGDV